MKEMGTGTRLGMAVCNGIAVTIYVVYVVYVRHFNTRTHRSDMYCTVCTVDE